MLDISDSIKNETIVGQFPYKKLVLPVTLVIFAALIFVYANYLNQTTTPTPQLPFSEQKSTLSKEKKQIIDNEMKNIKTQLSTIFKLIDADKGKVYKQVKGNLYEKNCDDLKQTLENLKVEVPYSHQLIAANINSLKKQLEDLEEFYKEGFASPKDWKDIKSAMNNNLRALNNLIDKLK